MKPTYETLLALAEAASEICGGVTPDTPQAKEFVRLVFKYRCEKPPLRTREEVDAEIVATVRAGGIWQRIDLERLCAEPTSGPSSVDATDPPPVPVSPVGADYLPDPDAVTDAGIIGTCHGCGLKNMHCLPIGWKNLCADCRALPDPEPCSCDEAEVLKDRIHELRRMVDAVHDLAKQIVGITETTPG